MRLRAEIPFSPRAGCEPVNLIVWWENAYIGRTAASFLKILRFGDTDITPMSDSPSEVHTKDNHELLKRNLRSKSLFQHLL